MTSSAAGNLLNINSCTPGYPESPRGGISSGRNLVGQKPTERTSDHIVQTVPLLRNRSPQLPPQSKFLHVLARRRINPSPPSVRCLSKHPEKLSQPTAVPICQSTSNINKHTRCGSVLINENVDEDSQIRAAERYAGNLRLELGWLCPAFLIF